MKKSIYVIEVRHQTGTKVYQINKSDLVELALDACSHLDYETFNDDNLLIESYLKQNNHYSAIFEDETEFVESVAGYLKYDRHNVMDLERSFKNYFKKDKAVLRLLNKFLDRDSEEEV